MRRSGQTTRLIDEAIQTLFTEGTVRIVDHHGTRMASELMFQTFMRRLSLEHRGMYDQCLIDKKRLEVTLLKS
jgi:hypothetical protein